ncbi:hypothetical protein J6590_086467 [Homalodisca vitripennis]|nr:hypothetical protein J6590_086467 [Homalodisca vitripennis]
MIRVPSCSEKTKPRRDKEGMSGFDHSAKVCSSHSTSSVRLRDRNSILDLLDLTDNSSSTPTPHNTQKQNHPPTTTPTPHQTQQTKPPHTTTPSVTAFALTKHHKCEKEFNFRPTRSDYNHHPPHNIKCKVARQEFNFRPTRSD